MLNSNAILMICFGIKYLPWSGNVFFFVLLLLKVSLDFINQIFVSFGAHYMLDHWNQKKETCMVLEPWDSAAAQVKQESKQDASGNQGTDWNISIKLEH